MDVATVYIINHYDGDVFGVYENEDTAWYAYRSAPGDCLEPQRKDVLCD